MALLDPAQGRPLYENRLDDLLFRTPEDNEEEDGGGGGSGGGSDGLVSPSEGQELV